MVKKLKAMADKKKNANYDLYLLIYTYYVSGPADCG